MSCSLTIFRRYKNPKSYLDGCDIAVAILSKPLKFDEYVRPVCLPKMDWTSQLNKGTMVASGMGMIGNDKRTSELKLASIQMLSISKCKSIEFPGSLFKGIQYIPYTKHY